MCKITTKSLEVPPSPPPSPRLRKAPRNSRCDSGRRPAFRMRLRYAEASADEGDVTKRGPRRASLAGSLSRELDDPELWQAEYPGPVGVGGGSLLQAPKVSP